MLLNETKMFTVLLEKIIVLNKLIDWISVTLEAFLLPRCMEKRKNRREVRNTEETGHLMKSLSRNYR